MDEEFAWLVERIGVLTDLVGQVCRERLGDE